MAKSNRSIYLDAELQEKINVFLNNNKQFSSLSSLISYLIEEYFNDVNKKKYLENSLEKDILELKEKVALAEIVLFNMANSQILDVTKNYPEDTNQYKFAKKMLEEKYNQSKMSPFKKYKSVEDDAQRENKFSSDINYFDR
ncbi:hypothetical protein RW115_11945 [Macrococcus capreoli]